MEKLIVALDVDTADEALRLADSLRGVVGAFKIGSRLFTASGPSTVQALTSRGDRVFLDLKFHDIPNTVAGAVAAATRLGVWMVNVHAAGGAEMMRAARAAADEEAKRAGRQAPLVIAVTILTSLNEAALEQVGMNGAVGDQVNRLAKLAETSGLDGVVASPQELALLRTQHDSRFAIVTPGIRGAGDEHGDQKRTMTAEQALACGASYLVVGRPIIGARDPRAAAEQIQMQVEGARPRT